MADQNGLTVEIASGPVGKTTKLLLKGYLDANTTSVLVDKVKALFQEGLALMAFDLKDVTFISSSGWGVLVGLSIEAQTLKGKIVLFNLISKVERIYNLLDLAPILPLYPDETKALNALDK